MSDTSAERKRLRGLIGRRVRDHDPSVPELRRDLRAATAEQYISELLAQAPPLTDDQRERLAELLAPPGPTVRRKKAA